MNDRYKLHQFYQGKENEVEYFHAVRLRFKDINFANLRIDYSGKWSNSEQEKRFHKSWIESIKNLDKVVRLKIDLIDQEIFNAVCEMKNLKELIVPTSGLIDFSGLKKVENLTRLQIRCNSNLTDLSFLKNLNLKQLSIEECFNIKNYEVIGEMTSLTGLSLNGNWTAPKNLRLDSIKPYENLENLEHLDLNYCTIKDKSFDSILKMENLRRFDFLGRIPKATRDLIKSNHPNLEAGFFMDWNYEKKEFYEDKNWDK